MKEFFKIGAKNLWVAIGMVIFLYLLYQDRFSWEGTIPSNPVPSKQTVFITALQTRYGVSSSSFSELMKSLKMWSFNPYEKKVFLKFSNMLPTSNTSSVLLYNHGFDAFSNESAVVSISTYPFHYYYQQAINLIVEKVNGNGQADILYNGKNLVLQPGESYVGFSIQDRALVKTVIQDRGLYAKSNFQVMSNTQP